MQRFHLRMFGDLAQPGPAASLSAPHATYSRSGSQELKEHALAAARGALQ